MNTRTDIFLLRWKAGDNPDQQALVDEAVGRAETYREAGASCFFAPGLRDPELVARLCEAVALPVNVLMLPDMVSPAELAGAGVARISWGGWPWRDAMSGLEKAAGELYA